MLVGQMYIMIFIAQSITQQKRNNRKKLSLQLFVGPAWPCLHPPKHIICVHLQYTLNIAKTHTLYTAYLAHTHIQFQLHLHHFNLGMPHTVLTQDFQSVQHCHWPWLDESAFLLLCMCVCMCD